MIAAGGVIVIETEIRPAGSPAEQRLQFVEAVDRDDALRPPSPSGGG